MTLPRRHRLSREGFQGAAREKRLTSEHFSLTITPVAPGSGRLSGAAAVVSKKTARRSVDRHLLKRRMLSALRPYLAPRRALVIYARAGAASLPFARLAEELSILLSRAGAVR